MFSNTIEEAHARRAHQHFSFPLSYLFSPLFSLCSPIEPFTVGGKKPKKKKSHSVAEGNVPERA